MKRRRLKFYSDDELRRLAAEYRMNVAQPRDLRRFRLWLMLSPSRRFDISDLRVKYEESGFWRWRPRRVVKAIDAYEYAF